MSSKHNSGQGKVDMVLRYFLLDFLCFPQLFPRGVGAKELGDFFKAQLRSGSKELRSQGIRRSGVSSSVFFVFQCFSPGA